MKKGFLDTVIIKVINCNLILYMIRFNILEYMFIRF